VKTLVIMVLLVGTLVVTPAAQAAGGTAERTTVARVYQRTAERAGFAYCDILLGNGRWLTYVSGADCQRRPGSPVMLNYAQRYVPRCDWLGRCRQELVQTLVSWW
jgi:hypothetical protein